jgi:fructokinase
VSRFGAIEAGGTKFVCGVGSGPADLESIQFPTTSPEATIGQAIDFFRGKALEAIGIAAFGPLDLRTGLITTTPKSGWRNTDIAGAAGRALGVPVGFDTDVNGAALGESRWGAAQGEPDFVYLTVGTGIGGGAMVNGQLVHGKLHTEMGHLRIPREPGDDYRGACSWHADCLEGLASGPAIEGRWGRPARELPEGHPAWDLEARYLALGLANIACTLSPRRIVLGGGVMEQSHLFPRIRREVARTLNGYLDPPDILPAMLGSRAGVLGALVLAERSAVVRA